MTPYRSNTNLIEKSIFIRYLHYQHFHFVNKNLNKKVKKMSILNNLIENCGQTQSTSLLFCLSPKSQTNSQHPRQRLSSCAPKIQSAQIERSSKSLTKMDLFSNIAKIDPKERTLHRLVYKLESKRRKIFFNFFVKLENYNKPSLSARKNSSEDNKSILIAVEKINQINSILFSKYFQQQIKKECLQTIKYFGTYQGGLKRILQLFQRVKKEQSFSFISNFAKKVEKQFMRIDILVTAANTIFKSSNKLKIKVMKRQNLRKLYENLKLRELQRVKNKQRQTKQKYENELNPITPQKQLFKQEKHDQIVSTYKAMKKRASQIKSSPCKPIKKIQLKQHGIQLHFSKNVNFLKACIVKTSFTQTPLQNSIKNDSYKISKKIKPDTLIKREINDLHDKNILFFAPEFQQKEPSSMNITQSSVQQLNFQNTSISQIYSVPNFDQHEHYEDTAKMSAVTRKLKVNSFGHEAVDFKNSLVVGRQNTNNQKDNHKKNYSFSKKKYHVNEKDHIRDDFDHKNSEEHFILQSKYSSAERLNYPYSIKIPQIRLSSFSSSYTTAEPDFQNMLTNRRTNSESLPIDHSQDRRSMNFTLSVKNQELK